MNSGVYANEKGKLRLDVDGPFNQHSASGWTDECHWAAVGLDEPEHDCWKGKVAFTSSKDVIPEEGAVTIRLKGNPGSRTANVDLENTPLNSFSSLPFKSEYFHQVTLNFCTAFKNSPDDYIPIIEGVTQVFEKARIKVERTGPEIIPVDNGAGHRWTDSQLNDKMKEFYERNGSDPGIWSIWVLFASRHEGDRLSGLMFDAIDSPYRQGCAVFEGLIRENGKGQFAPEEEEEEEIVKSIIQITCHEIGHCFNLAHSEDPMMGFPQINKWIKWKAEKNLSFMRGEWNSVNPSEFKFRFSGYDEKSKGRDMLFLRHAPESWVQPGGPSENLFKDKVAAFRVPRMNRSAKKNFEFILRRHRNEAKPILAFMEPLSLELKFTNVSNEPKKIDAHLLESADKMIVTIKKDKQASQLFRPYVRFCFNQKMKKLEGKPLKERADITPKHIMYQPLFVSAGPGGLSSGPGGKYKWYIADPGDYKLQVVLHVNGTLIPSNELVIHVKQPSTKTEETVAQDFFSHDVGRIIALDGSPVDTDGGNRALRLVTKKLPGHPATIHALVALGVPRLNAAMETREKALSDMKTALLGMNEVAPESLGYIDYSYYMGHLIDSYVQHNRKEDADSVQEVLLNAAKRRNLPEWVLRKIRYQYEKIGSKYKSAREVKSLGNLGQVLRSQVPR